MTKSSLDFTVDEELVNQIVELSLQKRAKNLVVLDLRGLSAFTDFFLICHGESEPQVKAITDHIRKSTKVKPRHIEGYESKSWILLDYFDVVVHIFKKGDREFYGLERLWADAPKKHVINEKD